MKTYTYASTTTRTHAVLNQFEIFLQYAGVERRDRKRLVRAVDHRWLIALGVYLRNDDGKRVLEAELGIEWEKHSDLAKLSPSVATDLPGWEDGAAPEVGVIGRQFGERARENPYPQGYWVRFTKAIRADPDLHRNLCKKVGVVYGGRPPDWASPPEEWSTRADYLEELNASVREA